MTWSIRNASTFDMLEDPWWDDSDNMMMFLTTAAKLAALFPTEPIDWLAPGTVLDYSQPWAHSRR